jgi:hypothetical protein
MSFCLSTYEFLIFINGLKLHTNIIILSVLTCFVLNNLLFTYGGTKPEKVVVICETENGTCCMEMAPDETEMCCAMEDCCARIPAQSAHANFSVIIGLDKKHDAGIQTPELTNFSLSHINQAAELSEGHLNSLIKPPASPGVA